MGGKGSTWHSTKLSLDLMNTLLYSKLQKGIIVVSFVYFSKDDILLVYCAKQ
jgi:hypothetical protein